MSKPIPAPRNLRVTGAPSSAPQALPDARPRGSSFQRTKRALSGFFRTTGVAPGGPAAVVVPTGAAIEAEPGTYNNDDDTPSVDQDQPQVDVEAPAAAEVVAPPPKPPKPSKRAPRADASDAAAQSALNTQLTVNPLANTSSRASSNANLHEIPLDVFDPNMKADQFHHKSHRASSTAYPTKSYYLGPSWLPAPLRFEREAARRNRWWLIGALLIGVLLVVAPIAAYYGMNTTSNDQASEVVSNAYASAFSIAPDGSTTVTAASFLAAPSFAPALSSLLGTSAIVFRNVSNIDPDTVLNTFVRDTWITEVASLLPFAVGPLSRSFCGNATLYGLVNTMCCVSVTADPSNLLGLTSKSIISPKDVQTFLSCDFDASWNPSAHLPGLSAALNSRPNSWFNSLQITSAGKFVISTTSASLDGLTIQPGVNIFAHGSILSPPASVTAALTPLLKNPIGSVDFVLHAAFPYNAATDTFTVTDASFDLAFETTDLQFGSNFASGSFSLIANGISTNPTYQVAGSVALKIATESGTPSTVNLAFSADYAANEPVTFTGSLTGAFPVFSNAAWARIDSAIVSGEFTAAPAFALSYLDFAGRATLSVGEFSGSARIYARVEKNGGSYALGVYAPSIQLTNLGNVIASRAPGAVADVVRVLTNGRVIDLSLASADMTIAGSAVKRGLGVTVNGVPLRDAVRSELTSAISSASSRLATTTVGVSAFLPFFAPGSSYVVQVVVPSYDVDSRLRFSNMFFALTVSSSFSTATLNFGGIANVFLPGSQTVVFNVAGSYTSATQVFTATGGLATPWMRPFGLTVLTVQSATATVTLAPSVANIAFSTSLRLEYADARPSVTLSGSYENGKFYIFTDGGVAISPVIPSDVKQFIDADGTVFVYLSTADQSLGGRPVSRGLTMAADNVSLKFGSSPIAQSVQNILGVAIPNPIPSLQITLPVFGSMATGSPRRDLNSALLDAFGNRIDHIWNAKMRLPDLSLWDGKLALRNNTLGASFNAANVASTRFSLGSSLVFSSGGSQFVLVGSADLSRDSTSFTIAGNLPEWNNPLGLSWLRVASTSISATFSSSAPSSNRFDVATRLLFGSSVNVAVRGQIASGGMYLAVYDINAGAVAALVNHAFKNLAPIPNADALQAQLSGLNLGVSISTNPTPQQLVSGGATYEIERGISLLVSLQRSNRNCTVAEQSTRSDCEDPSLTLLRNVLPPQFRQLGFRFGVVLPATVSGGTFKIFIQSERAMALNSRLTLSWVKLAAEFSVLSTRRSADSLVNELALAAQTVGHDLDAPLSPELLHEYHQRLRRAGVTGSLEISTNFRFQADQTTLLSFQVSGKVIADSTGVNVRAVGYMYGTGWRNAFGITGLTLNAASVGIGFGSLCPPCLTYLQLGASLSIGRRQVSFLGAFDLAAYGGFVKASYSGQPLTLIDLLQFINTLKPNTINMNAVPAWVSDLLSLNSLTVQIASSNMVIPDITQITVDNGLVPSSLPMIYVPAGFQLNASMTVLAVDVDIQTSLQLSPLDFRMSLFFSLAKINARVDAFVGLLRNLDDIPIIGDILDIPIVKDIMSFRINSVGIADFSTLGIVTGSQLPSASLSYSFKGETKTLTLSVPRLNLDIMDLIMDNVPLFPNCLVNSMCSNGQKCYHNDNGLWRCGDVASDGKCLNGMFTFYDTGCWPNAFLDQFLDWSQDVGNAITNGLNDAEDGVRDAIDKIGGIFG
ncbi:hypothetical protein CAOG_03536 [Capsaspora owczarzaki ATCC 30864]|uniref:Uncharacterized protein n=1 Tax=Capsaspora owczarzaki (strain ATCC 30864) TaxID=595528 RepID=A0A0D2VQ13_CAPO3|nr:hypothetical protein CAOG_03536 [Capsaspora owczarzaki ATCC 30864]KJE92612.1 hypothetical protein CAOG_003536 [Capsaspora owczarzaki ATCC 30864]|eukprot:XP_004348441.2 hypothetical protein CAOG_03536 [Capsaspora owczarzaki ATCC 30864]